MDTAITSDAAKYQAEQCHGVVAEKQRII